MIIIAAAIESCGEVPTRIAMRKFIYVKTVCIRLISAALQTVFIHILTVNISILSVSISGLSGDVSVMFSAVIVPL